MININTLLTNNSSAMTFPIEKPIFIKETKQGLYGSLTYYIAKNFAELPMQIIIPMMYSLMVYFALGLDLTAAKFFIFYLIIMLVQMTGVALGYIVGAYAPSPPVAMTFASLLPNGLMPFGGLYAHLGNINKAFS
mmetsp:Transcript_28679/g.28337  ORF Transcript_28679/g.28337 Transcript_28679/m.28337 type:complete len:135 (-) Transcript_28679:262-666(-)